MSKPQIDQELIKARADHINEKIFKEAKAICNTRWPKDYFANVDCDGSKVEVSDNATLVFECATDIR